VFPAYVPATRLAATFAHVLGVDAPREALGQPLPLPERTPAASPSIDHRVRAVRAVYERVARSSRTAMTLRALVAMLVVVAIASRYARTARTHRVVTLPLLVVAAGALGFAILGPGFTLSAIRTRAYFLVRSTVAITIGSALAWHFARPRGARARDVFVGAALPPLVALVTSWGSLGRANVDPYASLLAPTTGLLPAGVVTGVVLCELARKLRKPPASSTPSTRATDAPKKISAAVESSPPRHVGGV
jgi:hypothetical protein